MHALCCPPAKQIEEQLTAAAQNTAWIDTPDRRAGLPTEQDLDALQERLG